MVKVLVNIGLILVGVYLAGNFARQNPKFDAFLVVIEDGYDGLNRKIKDANIRQGVILLQRIYGVLAFLSVALFLVIPHVVSVTNIYLEKTSIFSLVFLAAWGALSWCLQHKKALKENSTMALLMIASPFALAFFEVQSGVPLLRAFLKPVYGILPIFNIHIDAGSGVWLLALLLSSLLVIALALQYIASWCIAIPVLFISIFLVLGAIYFARLVNTVAPQKAFFGLMVLAFVILNILQMIS